MMKKLISVLAVFGAMILGVNGQMLPVIPQPNKVEVLGGKCRDIAQIGREYRLDNSLSAEEYRIELRQSSVIIYHSTAAGKFYAEQTLEQLAMSQKAIPACVISDKPAMGYRGVMIDVSRHFMPMADLRRQVDAMARFKLNRLHIHLTDAAGWRMEIKKYPRLTQFAAWRTAELWKDWWHDGQRHYAEEGSANAFGGYYTQEELRELVKYAAERQITIIPEIEMPAHSEETLAAYPYLSCAGEAYKNADFCAGNDSVFEFIEDVLREVADVFPSEYLHIGGDEAAKEAWKTCPKCQHRMEVENLADLELLQGYFIKRVRGIAAKLGRKIIGWDEILSDESLPADIQIMVWRNEETGADAIKRGHSTIMSPGKYCYFDQYQDAPLTQPEAMGGYLSLRKVYEMPTELPYYGIQGNLWREFVPTTAHAESMIWPRSMAIAELAWTGANRRDYEAFHQNALAQTERMRAEGYGAFELKNEIGNRPESLSACKHLARGKAVKYLSPYSPKYPAGNEKALTDGLRGGWANNDNLWQGFIEKDRLDVVIDLEKHTKVKEISADFIHCPGPEIYLPVKVIISVSTDGENFTEIHNEDYPMDKKSPMEFRSFKYAGPKVKARFIRYQAQSGVESGWIFTDEIIVK